MFKSIAFFIVFNLFDLFQFQIVFAISVHVFGEGMVFQIPTFPFFSPVQDFVLISVECVVALPTDEDVQSVFLCQSPFPCSGKKMMLV